MIRRIGVFKSQHMLYVSMLRCLVSRDWYSPVLPIFRILASPSWLQWPLIISAGNFIPIALFSSISTGDWPHFRRPSPSTIMTTVRVKNFEGYEFPRIFLPAHCILFHTTIVLVILDNESRLHIILYYVLSYRTHFVHIFLLLQFNFANCQKEIT